MLIRLFEFRLQAEISARQMHLVSEKLSAPGRCPGKIRRVGSPRYAEKIPPEGGTQKIKLNPLQEEIV